MLESIRLACSSELMVKSKIKIEIQNIYNGDFERLDRAKMGVRTFISPILKVRALMGKVMVRTTFIMGKMKASTLIMGKMKVRSFIIGKMRLRIKLFYVYITLNQSFS